MGIAQVLFTFRTHVQLRERYATKSNHGTIAPPSTYPSALLVISAANVSTLSLMELCISPWTQPLEQGDNSIYLGLYHASVSLLSSRGLTLSIGMLFW